MASSQDASMAPASWARARAALRQVPVRATSTGIRGFGGVTAGALGRAIDLARGSSNDYGSGARRRSDRSRERDVHRSARAQQAGAAPTGPQQQIDWMSALEKVQNRVDAVDRYCHQQATTLADLTMKDSYNGN